MREEIVKDLTEKAAKKWLKKLISKLDELDEHDFFGTQGWRHFMSIED